MLYWYKKIIFTIEVQSELLFRHSIFWCDTKSESKKYIYLVALQDLEGRKFDFIEISGMDKEVQVHLYTGLLLLLRTVLRNYNYKSKLDNLRRGLLELK